MAPNGHASAHTLQARHSPEMLILKQPRSSSDEMRM